MKETKIELGFKFTTAILENTRNPISIVYLLILKLKALTDETLIFIPSQSAIARVYANGRPRMRKTR